jgi:hypothetical protein
VFGPDSLVQLNSQSLIHNRTTKSYTHNELTAICVITRLTVHTDSLKAKQTSHPKFLFRVCMIVIVSEVGPNISQ